MQPVQPTLFKDVRTDPLQKIVGTNSKREVLDRYYSKPWWVDILLGDEVVREHVGRRPMHVLEPFAGQDLALARRLAEHGHWVETADIDAAAPVHHHGNSYATAWSSCDAVISNPPFYQKGPPEYWASDAVRHFLYRSGHMLALAMRQTFLDPAIERSDVWRLTPADHVIHMPRESLRKGDSGASTDTVPLSWFVWFNPRDPRRRSTFDVVTRRQRDDLETMYRLEQRRRYAAQTKGETP